MLQSVQGGLGSITSNLNIRDRSNGFRKILEKKKMFLLLFVREILPSHFCNRFILNILKATNQFCNKISSASVHRLTVRKQTFDVVLYLVPGCQELTSGVLVGHDLGVHHLHGLDARQHEVLCNLNKSPIKQVGTLLIIE